MGPGKLHFVASERWSLVSLVLMLLAFLFLRLYIGAHATLEGDEFFSLGAATGHSLESHLANCDPVPELGDYVYAVDPVPAAYYQQYLAFDPRCPLPGSILRACLRGDWNAPLFYFVLFLCLKTFGISDLSTRLPSILFSLTTLPFIWLIASNLGGKRAAHIACWLFALAPTSLFYAYFARHYSLTIFFSALLIWLTFKLTSTPNRRTTYAILWAIVAGFGLLSTILFLGTFGPCALWLLIKRRSLSIKHLAVALLGSSAIALVWHINSYRLFFQQHMALYFVGVFPWYLAPSLAMAPLPAFFSSCTIPCFETYTLLGTFSAYVLLALVPVMLPVFEEFNGNRFVAILTLIMLFISGATELIKFADEYPKPERAGAFGIMVLAFALLFLCAFIFARKKNFGFVENFDARNRLLYLNVVTALLLPLLFDIIQSTHTSIVQRYALECLPSAFILAALALSKCKPLAQIIVVILTFCVWFPSYQSLLFTEGPMGEHYKAMARLLVKARDSDVIILNSPYRLFAAAVAHYLPADRIVVGRWNEHRSTQKPSDVLDVLTLIKGKTGVYLAKVYWSNEPDGPYNATEELLKQNARLEKTWIMNDVPEKQFSTLRERVLYFVPKQSPIF